MSRFATVLVALIVMMSATATVSGQATQPDANAATQPAATSQPAPDPSTTVPSESAFFDALDLTELGKVAVYRDGRVKTFASYAQEMIAYVTGPHEYKERPSTAMYFDLMLRPEAYADAEIIYVKGKLIRLQIADALRRSMEEEFTRLVAAGMTISDERKAEVMDTLEGELATFQKKGLIAQQMLSDPHVVGLLAQLERNLLTTAKFVDKINSAQAVRNPDFLADGFRVVPPMDGGFDDQWLTLDELGVHELPGGDPALRTQLLQQWDTLTGSWRRGDVQAVNTAATTLAGLLPQVNPEVYPESSRLELEAWYFGMNNLTWVWIIYAFSIIPLVLHVVFRWRGARWLGLALFIIAFALHTTAVMLRWYVAERWPNTNMYEAITTAAWFGGCFALIMEIWLRKTPIRSLLALGSGTGSMFALMVPHFLPLEITSGISNTLPVLHDVWLYIHTNVIIFSYCLIFIASITAGLYLLYRLFNRNGNGHDEYARVGGAGSLIMTTPDGGSYLERRRTTLGQVLDGTTMIVLEFAIILLWAGIVMGAIWADHSWGRPWGWDPKEVFALNTFIIFALMIHTRLKAKDKGLWTAWLAVAGCVVMLFNWVVINFTIAGLHSYA